MDSVLSNSQNDQPNQYKGKKMPEYVVDDKNDDFDDNHHHLLFGGTPTTTAETSAESAITAAVRPASSLQRARGTADELNLVNIASISTPASVKSDVRPTAPASSYETNPLPTMAKLGVAGTLALQSPTSDNAVPSGRRSGASDKVAAQLTNDATPEPILTGYRLSDLDPATRHQLAAASANDLFERLGRPVRPGTKDDTTMSVMTGGASRRKVEPVTNTDDSQSKLPPISGSTYRPATDSRLDKPTAGSPRATGDNRGAGIALGASGIATETYNTVYGAKPRPLQDIQGNSDGTGTGTRPRSLSENTGLQDINANNGRPKAVNVSYSAPDNGPLPRINRQSNDGALANIVGGMQNVVNEANNGLPPLRRAAAADHAIIQAVPLNPTRSIGYPEKPADQAVRTARANELNSGVPLPLVFSDNTNRGGVRPSSPAQTASTRGSDLAQGMGLPGAIVSAGDRGPANRPPAHNADVLPPVLANIIRPLANQYGDLVAPTANRSPVVDRSPNCNDAPALTPRRETLPPAPLAGTVPIFKDDGLVYMPTVKPANRDVAANPISAPTPGAKPDGVAPCTDDKSTARGIGNLIENGARGLANNVGNVLNPFVKPGDPITARGDMPAHNGPGVKNDGQRDNRTSDGINLSPASPAVVRNGEPLPAARTHDGIPVGDKPGRTAEPGAGADRGGIRTNEGTLPGGNNLPGGADRNLARNGEPAVSGDRGSVRNPDGRMSDTIRSGESVARSGESVARSAEPTGRTGDTALRTADGASRAAVEANARTGEGVSKGNEAVAKVTDTAAKAGETGTRVQEVAKVADIAKIADAGLKVADATVKPVDGQVKAATDIVAATARTSDGSARISGDAAARGVDVAVRLNDQNATVRSQDMIANNGQIVSADRNIRLADAIVKAADQVVKAPDIIQPAKLDITPRAAEQNLQNAPNSQNAQNVLNNNSLTTAAQGNQGIANNQQQIKNEAARPDANAGTRAGDQSVAQYQPIIQNQIASTTGKEQSAAQNIKATPDCPQPAQRSPNNNGDIKVDQVVADILNHVRNNSKDQQAGAKILSSLDQNNAANQQLDPRGLLDAAAVRRILDGQGVALSPETLNTLMEGLRPTGEHAVDYALPSIGSLNLSQIISLGERLQEAVAGAGNETSEPQPKPQLQQHRTKYFVKEGDTLESIAQEKLGDARLVQLLITINRALVNYRLEGESKVAYVVPNQYLWLPTDHELEIHKRNFFGKLGKDSSVSLSINSKQNTPLIPPVSFDRTQEVSAEIYVNVHDFRPAQSGSISAANTAGKMAGKLDKVRHAGGRQSVRLDEIEFASTQVSHRQCYQVREGETLMSIAASLQSMGHISMWKLLAKINGFQLSEAGLGKPVDNLYAGQFIVLPTTEELDEFKLLEKLTSCTKSASESVNSGAANNAFACVVEQKHLDSPPPPALVALAQGVGGLTTVHKLSSYTRLVLNDLPQLENCFSVTVEARWNGQWKPMASYECRHGQTTRHLYNKHGEIKSMELELPPFVVKEMAREDFIRNWNAYVNMFMGNTSESLVQS